MPNYKTINLVIFGIGNVGNALIHQIITAKQVLAKQKLHLRIPIITNSKFAFFDKEGIYQDWEHDFDTFSVPFKIEDIIQFVNEQNYENIIAIDATSSEEFAQNYLQLIENGFHIVAANKIANTLHFEFYKQLRLSLKRHRRYFLYETNVGAGLPIIETIKNLYGSGEQIKKIRGVFSGSLSYIFNTFSTEDIAFSKVLDKASQLGLTEPDAREDLSGNDVARKLLILARELGIEIEFKEISIESLVPKQLNGNTTLQQFKNRSVELDLPLKSKKDHLYSDEVLRYIGELDVHERRLQVKLISEKRNSAIGQLKGSDSIFEIYTESYGDHPLVIQGAGAGKDVTARGLLSDVIKLSTNLN